MNGGLWGPLALGRRPWRPSRVGGLGWKAEGRCGHLEQDRSRERGWRGRQLGQHRAEASCSLGKHPKTSWQAGSKHRALRSSGVSRPCLLLQGGRGVGVPAGAKGWGRLEGGSPWWDSSNRTCCTCSGLTGVQVRVCKQRWGEAGLTLSPHPRRGRKLELGPGGRAAAPSFRALTPAPPAPHLSTAPAPPPPGFSSGQCWSAGALWRPRSGDRLTRSGRVRRVRRVRWVRWVGSPALRKETRNPARCTGDKGAEGGGSEGRGRPAWEGDGWGWREGPHGPCPPALPPPLHCERRGTGAGQAPSGAFSSWTQSDPRRGPPGKGRGWKWKGLGCPPLPLPSPSPSGAPQHPELWVLLGPLPPAAHRCTWGFGQRGPSHPTWPTSGWRHSLWAGFKGPEPGEGTRSSVTGTGRDRQPPLASRWESAQELRWGSPEVPGPLGPSPGEGPGPRPKLPAVQPSASPSLGPSAPAWCLGACVRTLRCRLGRGPGDSPQGSAPSRAPGCGRLQPSCLLLSVGPARGGQAQQRSRGSEPPSWASPGWGCPDLPSTPAPRAASHQLPLSPTFFRNRRAQPALPRPRPTPAGSPR